MNRARESEIEDIVDQVISQNRRDLTQDAITRLKAHLNVTQSAARYLADWACPLDWVWAIQLAPVLGHFQMDFREENGYLRNAFHTAREYIWWNRRTLPIAAGRSSPSPLQIQRLQKLYLASYEDEAIPFLGMAEILGQLDLFERLDSNQKSSLVKDIEVVLFPLLERFGLWQLFRNVSDRLFEQSDYPAQESIANLILDNVERQEKVLCEVDQALKPFLPRGSTVAIHPIRPSRIFQLVQEYKRTYPDTEAEEWLQRATQRLVVDITVETTEQCYLVLGLVHRAWRPVGNNIKDYIGSPKFNGYQAITTLVSMNPSANSSVNVGFFIRSYSMEEINSWGRIAEFRRNKHQYPSEDPCLSRAWWHDTEEQKRLLNKLKPGDYSSPTFVFSPVGQLYEVVQYGTPLDYAYAVHSDLGHSYQSAIVNGRMVGPDFVLANADIVNIQVEPSQKAQGQAKWLNQVKSTAAAKQLRRKFARQLNRVQRGRELTQKAFQDWYEHYGIKFSEAREKSYLIQAAKRWSFGDLESFYSAIASGRIAPEPIANFIISLEVAHLIANDDGSSLKIGHGRLSIAHCCRPCVDDPIVGRVSQSGTKHERIKIHKASCSNIADSPVIPLTWRKADYHGLYEFLITGYDREGILIDVLQPFYDRHAYLHKVEAQRLKDDSAQFLLVAELSDSNETEYLRSRIENLPEIVECKERPLTLSPSETIARKKRLETSNPFRYDRPAKGKVEFVGRQDELNEIKRLIGINDPASRIVVYGPWKVGKTSLLEYIAENDHSEFGALAVLVDCHKIRNLSLETLLAEIINATKKRIRQETDTFGAYQIALGEDDYRDQLSNPVEGFRRFLARVKPILNIGDQRRLVIMIDEFSDLYDDVQRGKLDRSIFRNLRGLFELEAEIVFITVIQAAVIHEMRSRAFAGVELLESSYFIQLGGLEGDVIVELLQRKLRQLNLVCDDELLGIVLVKTGGNPYIMNVLCHTVIELLKESGEITISLEHIETAIGKILNEHGEIYFIHLTELVANDDLGKTILSILSKRAHQEGENAENIYFECSYWHQEISRNELDSAIQRLIEKGL